MKIGVLALQGAFEEHERALNEIGVEARLVRLPHELDELDGLILPGGESTTFAKLAAGYGLVEPLRRMAKSKPMWGTCAGLVFMAKDVGTEQPLLQVMDVTVKRNAFGRQVDSFEEDIEVDGVSGGPFHGIFIRAPEVLDIGPDVEVVSRLRNGRIVGVRQGRLFGTSFHPELTSDTRLHAYFAEIAGACAKQ